MGLFDDVLGGSSEAGSVSTSSGGLFDDVLKPKKEARSAVGEIANQFKAGILVDLPKMAGQALKYTSDPGNKVYEAGQGITDWADEQGKRPDLAPQEDQHNIVTNALASGARMIPQSVAPAAAVGAGILALPASIPATVGLGAASVLGAVPAAMSQGQETLEKAREKGIPEDQALAAARSNALIEGGGEALGTYAGGKLLGIAGKTAGKMFGRTASDALADQTSTAITKPFLKQLGETALVETGTEIGQNAGEAAVENAYGIDSKTPYEAGKEAIAPTLGMTALLAPFGLAGFAHAGKQRGERTNALASAETTPEDRQKIASEFAAEIGKVDENAAANFMANAQSAIDGKQALSIGESMFLPPVAAEETPAPLALPAPTYTGTPSDQVMAAEVERQNQADAAQKSADALYAERAAFEQSKNSGIAAAPVIPVVGPLSAAANLAVQSGAHAATVAQQAATQNSQAEASSAKSGTAETPTTGNREAAPQAGTLAGIAAQAPSVAQPAPNTQPQGQGGTPATAQQAGPAATSPAGVQATTINFDVSNRTDAQLNYLSQHGQPGWKEAAAAEIQKRDGQVSAPQQAKSDTLSAEKPANSATVPAQNTADSAKTPAAPVEVNVEVRQNQKAKGEKLIFINGEQVGVVSRARSPGTSDWGFRGSLSGELHFTEEKAVAAETEAAKKHYSNRIKVAAMEAEMPPAAETKPKPENKKPTEPPTFWTSSTPAHRKWIMDASGLKQYNATTPWNRIKPEHQAQLIEQWGDKPANQDTIKNEKPAAATVSKTESVSEQAPIKKDEQPKNASDRLRSGEINVEQFMAATGLTDEDVGFLTSNDLNQKADNAAKEESPYFAAIKKLSAAIFKEMEGLSRGSTAPSRRAYDANLAKYKAAQDTLNVIAKNFEHPFRNTLIAKLPPFLESRYGKQWDGIEYGDKAKKAYRKDSYRKWVDLLIEAARNKNASVDAVSQPKTDATPKAKVDYNGDSDEVGRMVGRLYSAFHNSPKGTGDGFNPISIDDVSAVVEEAKKVGITVSKRPDTSYSAVWDISTPAGNEYLAYLSPEGRGTWKSFADNSKTAPEAKQEQAPAITTPQHVENGKAEPATAAVVQQSLKKGADNSPLDLRQERDLLLQKVDQAIAAAPTAEEKDAWDRVNQKIDLKNNMHVADTIGYRVFDVPGDGKFKVLNLKEALQRFRERVEASPGFKKPSNSTGLQTVAPWQRTTTGGTEATTKELLDAGEYSAAVEYAKQIGKPLVFGQYQDGSSVTVYTDSKPFEHDGYDDFKMVSARNPGAADKVAWSVIDLNSGLTISSKHPSRMKAIIETNKALDKTTPEQMATAVRSAKANMPGIVGTQEELEQRWLVNVEQREADAQAKADHEHRKGLRSHRGMIADATGKPTEDVGKKPAQAESSKVDYKGFERVPLGNGAFELRDGNMTVKVTPQAQGKYQATYRSAKSSPHLVGEQGAVDWAASYRDAARQNETDDQRYERIRATPVMQRDDKDVKWANEYKGRQQKSEAEAEAKKAEEQKAAIKADSINGFLDGKAPMQAGAIRNALNKQWRFDGVVMTARDRIESLWRDGKLAVSTYEENKIKPMSRRDFNRASQREQDAHEKKMREAGTKTVYVVSESELGKIAHDYAQHLLAKNAEVKPSEVAIELGGGQIAAKLEKPLIETTKESLIEQIKQQNLQGWKDGNLRLFTEKHGESIKAAMDAGKTVPDDVLADYPGLIRDDLNDDQRDQMSDDISGIEGAARVKAIREWKAEKSPATVDAVKQPETKAKSKAVKPPSVESAKDMAKSLKASGYPFLTEIGNSYRPEVRVTINSDDRYSRFDVVIERKDGAWEVQEFSVPEFSMEIQVDGMRKFRNDLSALNRGEWPETDQGIALYSKSAGIIGDSGLGKVEIKPATSIKPIADILAAENATQVVVKGGNVNALNRVAKLFGKQIIFFRTVDGNQSENGAVGAQSGRADSGATEQGNRVPADGYITNGFVNTGRPDTVFLNVDSSNHLLYILGHELGHTLRMDDPKLWAGMAKQLQPLIRRWSQYKANMGQSFADESANAEELFGDIIGQNFLNQEFWNELAQENQSLFQKIANTAIKILNKAMSLIAGKDVSIYVSDMKQARAVIAKVMAQYAENKGMYQSLANQYDGDYINKRMVAWHGSPHDHDKFDSSKIGTGEGAQAYGWGLYFAGKKEVAEFYRDTLSKQSSDPLSVRIRINGKPIGELLADRFRRPWDAKIKVAIDGSGGNLDAAIDSLKTQLENQEHISGPNEATRSKYAEMYSFLEDLKNETVEVVEPESGRLYEVELAPNEDEFLLWDKPLSEQSDTVKAALGIYPDDAKRYAELSEQIDALSWEKGGLDSKEWNSLVEEAKAIRIKSSLDLTGGDFYAKTKNDLADKAAEGTSKAYYKDERWAKAASDYLHSIGIRGIRYLDGSSRSAGEGNSNYVIFSDDDVTITAKYNLAYKSNLSPADKAIYGMAAEGKSAEDILKFIGSASRNPFYRQLAKLLMKTGIAPSVTVGDGKGWKMNAGEGNKYAAGYNPKSDTISLFRPASAERNMLHELMHAATLKALSGKGMASAQMKALYNHVKKTGKLKGMYGMSDVDEFIAEAFSNPKFQAALKQVAAPKASGALSSAWNWFVRIVKGILGLPANQENALSQALEIGLGVMREDMALRRSGIEMDSETRYAQGDKRTASYADVYQKRADQLDRAFTSMGLETRRESSGGSMSEYVEVKDPNNEETTYKFRVSNHRLPSGYAQPDFDVIADGVEHDGAMWNASGTWIDAVNWISDKTGKEPRGIIKAMAIKRRHELDSARQAEATEREKVKAQYSDQNNRIIAEKIKLSDWLGYLPDESTLAVSGKGKLSATKPNGEVVLYGAKPFGMANSTKTIDDARKYIESAPTPNSAATRLPGAPDKVGMQKRSMAEPAQSKVGAGGKTNAIAISDSVQASAIKAAQKVQDESNAFDLEEEIKSVSENGESDLSSLIANPKYWDAENEEFTDEGYKQVDLMNEQKARDNLRLLSITDLSDLDSAYHEAQYAAMVSILDGMGIEYKDTSSNSSKYLEVGRLKLRFADHANTTRSVMAQVSNMDEVTSLINVAPGEYKFAEALDAVMLENMKATAEAGGTHYAEGQKQTDTTAFRKWFGDSKVVDAQGDPLVVYHGTGATDISEFKVSTSGTYGGGIYLTPEIRGANDYAIYRGAPSSTVYPVYAAIKNPASGSEAAQVASWKGEENAREELIKRGYDGVVDMRSGEIVAFYPEQIKSAIGNNGDFDPNNQDIRYNAAPGKINQTDTEAFKRWFGDSAVVDSDGKPLRVFHGTASDITAFDIGRSGESTGNTGFYGAGAYFSEDADYASGFSFWARRSDDQAPNVVPVYLSLKNPAYINITPRSQAASEKSRATAEKIISTMIARGTDQAVVDKLQGFVSENKFEPFMGTLYNALGGGTGTTALLKEAGFDGVTIYGGISGKEKLAEAVAFDPTQIKSAIGNNGDFDPNNQDIRYNVADEGWSVSEPSKMDDVIYALQDKHIDTKRVMQAIMGAGKKIKDSFNPYLQEELFHGRSAKGVKDFLDFELRPLLKQMQDAKVDMGDFEEYLWNRHAEERNQQIAKINPDMQDGGSGIDTATARAYLVGLGAEQRRTFESLAAKVEAMNKASQRVLVESGLEKQSTIDAWNSAYKHYVPLQREDVDNGHVGTGKGFSVRGSSTKRAMGSGKNVVDIIANLTMQRERNIVRAEKNRVSNALMGLAVENPNKDFWTVDAAPKERVVEETAIYTVVDEGGAKLGEFTRMSEAEKLANKTPGSTIDQKWGDRVTERVVPGFKNRDNVLLTRVNGDDHYIIFNERDERAMRMATAMKNMDVDNLGRVLSLVGRATRYLSAINTQYNPVFGVINLIRDAQGALINLSSTPLAGEQKRVLGYTKDALVGIYKDIRAHRAGKVPSSKWAALFEEFQKEGGQTGYRDQYANAEARAESIVSELAQFKEGKAKQLTRGVFGWLSDYNETMENATRLAAYKAAKEKGMSNQQAASLAKNITVNFNRKGQMATQVGALYAFFNASVQGTARIAETLFDMKDGDIKTARLSKTGKKIVYGGIMLGSMQALLLAAAGFDDDEPPEFIRERNLILPVGDGKYLTLAMPLGFHVIPGIGRIATEFVLSGGKDPLKKIAAFGSMFAEALNPIGNSGFSLQTITPSVIDPLAALAENRDFTGKEIYQNDFNKLNPTPGFTRAKDTATAWSKAIAEGLNFITGGTDYKPGLFTPTPDQIDYLIGQVTGGVGREVGKVSQVVSATTTGEDLPIYKVPLVGRFVGDTQGKSGESAKFYNSLREINMHEAEYKGLIGDGKRQEAAEYLAENPAVKLIMLGNQSERAVKKLKEAKRNLIENDAPQEKVAAMEDQIAKSMKLFNDRVTKALAQ